MSQPARHQPRLQESADKAEHPLVPEPAPHTCHKHVMVHPVEELLHIHHESFAGGDILPCLLHRSKLPPLWAAILLGFVAAAACGGPWYMRVILGWRPREPRPLKRRLAVFALSVAAVILTATVWILMILDGD